MTIDRAVSYRIHKTVEEHYFKGGKRIADLISKLLLPLPKGRVIVENREKQKVLLNPSLSKGIESSLFYSGRYEAGVTNIIDKYITTGNNFLEIGANVAPHSMFVSKKIGIKGKILAFEPDKYVKEVIDRNIVLNNIVNIESINVGLGDRKSEMKLYSKPEINSGASSLIKEPKNKSVKVKIEVLDDFLKPYNLNSVEMAVIDVEGWELNVLKGAKKTITKFKPLLCVEINSKYNPQDLFDYLKSFNIYSIYQLHRPKEYVSKLKKVHNYSEVRLDDNIFCLTEKQEISLQKVISS